MINDIVDFLPKYPNINNYVNDVLNPYENFYESIFLKKEFPFVILGTERFRHIDFRNNGPGKIHYLDRIIA